MDRSIHLLNNWELVCMWRIHFIMESKREVPSCLSSSGFCKGSFSFSVFSRRAFSLRVEGGGAGGGGTDTPGQKGGGGGGLKLKPLFCKR